MKIFVGCDHAGFQFKHALMHLLPEVQFEDLGTFSEDRADYPDFADLVAKKVLENGAAARGILICGTGQGMAIRANRHKRIRAAVCWDVPSAFATRRHNDANVLCLGARLLPIGLAVEIAKCFLVTEFEGGRHQPRVEKLDK